MIFEVSNAKLKQNFNPRRFGIHAQKVHIFGAPQSGKTSIALNFARGFKNPLYMDFADLRNTDELIRQTLLKSAIEKKVDLLILDNVPSDFNAHFGVEVAVITIAQTKMNRGDSGANRSVDSKANRGDFGANRIDSSVNRVADLNTDFVPLEILPLNFEEFISFDSQNLNLNELFERFIKFGNLPFVLSLRDWQKLEAKQKMLFNALGQDMDIFLTLMRFQSSAVSVFQLYNILKKDGKMSKDRIYGVISDFVRRGILRSARHLTKPKAPKKAYFFDFSVKSAVSYERNFMASFENMVFLEILGRKGADSDIFYSDKIPLICDKDCFFLMPFKSKEVIAETLKSVDFMGFTPRVITIDLNDEIVVKGRKVRLISFINFALD